VRLQGTTESLELVTSSTGALDVLVDWSESEIISGDISKGAIYSDDFALVTATTTTILAAAAAAGIRREVSRLSVRNKSNSLANQVTLQKDVAGTNFEYFKATLSVGDTLQYSPQDGWSIIDSAGMRRAVVTRATSETGYPLELMKVSTVAEAVGIWHFLGKDAGSPGAWSPGTPGLSGRTCDGTTVADAGALRIPNPAVGQNFLTGFSSFMSNVAGMYALYDMLLVNSGLVVTTTTAQTTNTIALPARDRFGTINGEGVIWGLYVSVATTNAAAIANCTMSYTDSAGNAGNTATMLSFPATAAVGTFVPFNLAAGDIGAKSVESVTLGTSLLTGTIHLMAVRMIAGSPLSSANTPGGTAASVGDGVRLYNGVCLLPFVLPSATTAIDWKAIATVNERVL
jgi:hypothetical protein